MEKPILETIVIKEGEVWIDVLEDEQGQPLYRTCGQGGGICRYSSDRWQAEIYATYY